MNYECWVLFRHWSDSPGAEILRVYTDQHRAQEDFDLVAEDTIYKHVLVESTLYSKSRSTE